MKAEELGKRIKLAALASAAGGAVPIPGVSAGIDLTIIMAEVKFQRKQLQIDSESMKKHTERFGPEFKEKLEAGAGKVMKSFLVHDMALAAVITARLAASEIIEAQFKPVPFLGSIAGATISAGVTYKIIRVALDAHTEIAQKTLVVVNELTLKKDLKKDE